MGVCMVWYGMVWLGIVCSVRTEKLVLELDPLQTKRVQKRGQILHDHEHDERDDGPCGKSEPSGESADVRVCGDLQPSADQNHILEEFSQLRVCQRKRPQPQVGSSVRDGSQDKLDGVDRLVDESVAKRELMLIVAVAAIVMVGDLHMLNQASGWCAVLFGDVRCLSQVKSLIWG